MTVRAYQWLGVALFACMAGLLLLMAQNKIGLDFDWFERIAWGVAIAYVVGGVFIVRRERKKEAGGSNSSDADSRAYPVLSERVIPPVAPSPQPVRGHALPVAVFLGLMAIAAVLGYHYKVERERTLCFEMIKGLETQLGNAAHTVLAMRLRGEIDEANNGSYVIRSTEHLFGSTFAECRARFR